MARRVDERFAHAVTFCEEMCGTLDPKSLLLCSQNPYFSWCLGEESLRRLSLFRNLDSLVLENMTGAEVFGGIKASLCLDNLKEIRMRLDAKHQNEVENILWVDVQAKRMPKTGIEPVSPRPQRGVLTTILLGPKAKAASMPRERVLVVCLIMSVPYSPVAGSLLTSLAQAHVRCLDFSAFSESPAAITAITAADMCQFIVSWRALKCPWMIRSIMFNSTVTISEFRTVAGRAGLFATALTDIPYCRALKCPWMIRSIMFNSTVTISEFRTVAGRAGLFATALTDIPYCRFRTYHPSDPNAKLELSCYGTGVSTVGVL
ncbi:unnamed protein product [Strongylus vulgaris]|uniref:Uncharacterized protein n=1 Tax=Strongylus vulgaris TaxID=40348 RepID=A0A3P7J691_STRVU|nr:unnamed protein product [Strongylus vulgaris]